MPSCNIWFRILIYDECYLEPADLEKKSGYQDTVRDSLAKVHTVTSGLISNRVFAPITYIYSFIDRTYTYGR